MFVFGRLSTLMLQKRSWRVLISNCKEYHGIWWYIVLNSNLPPLQPRRRNHSKGCFTSLAVLWVPTMRMNEAGCFSNFNVCQDLKHTEGRITETLQIDCISVCSFYICDKFQDLLLSKDTCTSQLIELKHEQEHVFLVRHAGWIKPDWGEEDEAASPTCHPGAVDHLRPLLLIGGDLDIVTVGTLVTVPQQQPEQPEEERRWINTVCVAPPYCGLKRFS